MFGLPLVSVSQLAGPSNRTTQGVVGHLASAFVTTHPGAARGGRTWTVRGTLARWSMLSWNGIGEFSTLTFETGEVTTRFTVTAGPALTFVRSKVAWSLSEVTVCMASARP